jgi:hypothetical protein
MKYQTDILGKQVLPLPIKKGMISGTEADKVHASEWLTSDKRQEYYKITYSPAIDGKKYTVYADQLKRAIDNAQNAHER